MFLTAVLALLTAAAPAADPGPATQGYAALPSDKAMADLYPRRALKLALESRVLLACAAAADGALSDCRVVSADWAEHGFGAASLTLVEGVRAPAFGEPARVQIPIAWQHGEERAVAECFAVKLVGSARAGVSVGPDSRLAGAPGPASDLEAILQTKQEAYAHMLMLRMKLSYPDEAAASAALRGFVRRALGQPERELRASAKACDRRYPGLTDPAALLVVGR